MGKRRRRDANVITRFRAWACKCWNGRCYIVEPARPTICPRCGAPLKKLLGTTTVRRVTDGQG